MKSLKVLVSAYACEPYKGSEPEVGWQWVRQIARYHEAWVITRANNRENIERGLDQYGSDNLNFIYVDAPNWVKFWKRGSRGVHVYYHLWQAFMYRRATLLDRQVHFDLAHHLTFLNMYIAPWLSLIDRPLVWGPIGANPYVRRKCWHLMGRDGVGDNVARYLVRATARVRDPLYSHALKKATRIITINNEVKHRLRAQFQRKAFIMSQNAVDTDDLSVPKRRRNSPLRILMVGQLVPIKGYWTALSAFARHRSVKPGSSLTIVGDGKQMTSLKMLVAKLRVADAVQFMGRVPRSSVLEIMQASDVFLFPSFEGAGMVVIEAMAKGLPVVCLDFGGPGEYVTDECGIKVPLAEPNQVIEGLAQGLNRLASDSYLYERLSTGAIQRVRDAYLWDQIGDRLNGLYREAIEEGHAAK